jgi:hypothetical protein
MFGDRHDRRLARTLRAQRPQPPDRLIEEIRGSVAPSSRPVRGRRLALAGAVPVFIVVLLSAFGGLGYAASGTEQAASAVRHVVAPAKQHRLVAVHHTAAHSQYGSDEVTLCHHGHTITVDEHSLPAHLAHHDRLGPCGAH